MKRLVILATLSALALSGCTKNQTPEERENAINSQVERARTAKVDVKAVDIGGEPVRCLPSSDIGQRAPSYELKGELRTRMLTPDAEAAGVRVYVAGSDVSSYGSTVVLYSNDESDCMLWSETLSLQEYNDRLGLSPLKVANGYTVVAAKGE